MKTDLLVDMHAGLSICRQDYENRSEDYASQILTRIPALLDLGCHPQSIHGLQKATSPSVSGIVQRSNPPASHWNLLTGGGVSQGDAENVRWFGRHLLIAL